MVRETIRESNMMLADHKKKLKDGSRTFLLPLLLLLTGCGEGATLLQESDRGGVVVYSFKGEQGALLASFRNDALALMKEKCGGAYSIIREGETKGRVRVAGPVEGAQEVVQERRWGIHFQCK
ncbi:MAG: hypothetical protein LZF86_210090 [Nitrospira sp.]|nr:MAG: hypothetical protein LZF86_210090 [Nitrospira sp.]